MDFKSSGMNCSEAILIERPQRLAFGISRYLCRLFPLLCGLITGKFRTYGKYNKQDCPTKLAPFISFQIIDEYWHNILAKFLEVISISRASLESCQWIFVGDPKFKWF